MTTDHIDSKYPFFLILAQSDTEAILAEHLSQFGVQVERGVELVDFEVDARTVTSQLMGPDGPFEIRSRYLVGCDGAHSRMRKLLGIEFEGAPYPNQWLLADCKVDWGRSHTELAVFIHPKGVTGYFPLYATRGRLMFELPDSSIDEQLPEPTLDDVVRLARERGLVFETITNPSWLAHFRLHHRIAKAYQKGPVFIAGDAAHIHSPLGGQGMNTGIQDAYNLAWKLGLVRRGAASEQLLESYQIERHAIGEGVVDLTDRMTKVVGIRNPVLSAIRNKVIRVATSLDAVQRRVLARLSQVELHYKNSPIVAQDFSVQPNAHVARPADDTVEPGERVGDAKLRREADGSIVTLYSLFTGAEHELLLFSGGSPSAAEVAELGRVAELIERGYRNWIEVHLIRAGSASESLSWPELASRYVDPRCHVHQLFSAGGPSLYLICPDGYVAYRNQPARLDQLETFLRKVFQLEPPNRS